MTKTIKLDETIEVSRPINEAFAYISEFSRIEEWDPAVARGTRLTEGALGVGSEFRIDMKAGFSLHYTVTAWEPERRLLMRVDSKVFTAVEEILFTATNTGTRIQYIATFKFPTALGLIANAFPGLMDRVGKSAVAGMKRALDDQMSAPLASRSVALGDKLLLPGLFGFTRLGYRRARKQWNPVSAYLGDCHVLITGATSGLGLATAEVLAARGAELTLVARDGVKAKRIAKALTKKTGNARIHIEIAELSLLAEVNALADRVLKAGRPIDVLINNAGALINPRTVTSEGLEKSFALLLLSPYLLTERLYPLLKVKPGGRVINVLSGGMYSQGIHLDDLQNAKGKYSGSVAYARAKRGLMMLTSEWAKRWQADGIVVNAMHPGWADTPGVESSLPAFHRVTKKILRTPAEGADTIIWLATATEAAKVSGEFWLDRQPHPAHVLAHTQESVEDRQALIKALSKLVAMPQQ
ncbi:MAG: SDR family NAD(P)-dependent oxidoreductase [Rhodocyclaceae bacterium]|nr:SDR family NAD(P)-dependent oxidoreductase [Rhodocyclaceae bacterium]